MTLRLVFNPFTGTFDEIDVLGNILTAGSVGSATRIPIITYSAKGLITATTSAAVEAPRAFAYFAS